ncbi:hypothetical protein D3C84_479850 [compost metagenome]
MLDIENFRPGGKLSTRFELADTHALAGVVLPDREYIDIAQVPLMRGQRVGRNLRREQCDGRAHGSQFASLQVHNRGSRITGLIHQAIFETENPGETRIGDK